MRFRTPMPASQATLSERQFRRKEMKIELLPRGTDHLQRSRFAEMRVSIEAANSCENRRMSGYGTTACGAKRPFTYVSGRS